jgi:hypothetical protein
MLDVAAVFEIGLKLPFHFEYYKNCFPDYRVKHSKDLSIGN